MKFVLAAVSFLVFVAALAAQSIYESNMVFYTYNTTGGTTAQMNFTFDNNATFLQTCNKTQNWTIVSHAWHENIKKPWTMNVVKSFLELRGGCVMFLDFDYFAKMPYAQLANNFDGIGAIVVRKLKQMEELGFNPGNAFLFGNGISSLLFFVGAYNYSPCTIGRIDACDPAGPRFLNQSMPVQLAKKTAKNVVCYHTSSDQGTNLRYCQKDINFGRCGVYQPASVTTHITNHQLCPYIYNNTFTVDFDIVSKYNSEVFYKTRCFNQSVVPSLLPNEAVHVGPRMKTCIPNGEYYVLTSSVFPYSIKSNYTA